MGSCHKIYEDPKKTWFKNKVILHRKTDTKN